MKRACFFACLIILAFALLGFSCANDDDDDSSDDSIDDDDTSDNKNLDDDDNDDNQVNDDDDAAMDDDSSADDDDTNPEPVFEDPEPSDDIGVFVAKSGNDANPGTMQEPKLTLAAGLTQAQTGGKILFVAQGTYIESVIVEVSMYGGYEESNWTRDIYNQVTTLKSMFQETTLLIPQSAGEVTIDGFFIPGDNSGFYSNAIVVDNISSFTLTRNTIITPTIIAPFIMITAVTIKADSVAFQNNTIIAGRAQGIWDASMATSIGAVVQANQALFVNNLIAGGAAPEGFNGTVSQGLDLTCKTATLVNNTFISKEADYNRALIVEATSQVDIINNIMQTGPGISSNALMVKNGIFTLRNNNLSGPIGSKILWTPTGLYPLIGIVNGCAWIGCSDASGNISGNPRFQGDKDYHLKSTSPCIDTGTDPSAWYSNPPAFIDIDGDIRPTGTGWDIGMDEF